jgi:putative YhbY family RNA-binding protein
MRARAHGLSPVVSIAEKGLADSVLKEIDTCLKTHELIKIRVYGDDRELREAYLAQICAELGAAPVQHIGKLLVVYRPAPVETAKASRARKSATNKSGRTTKRSLQGPTRK